MKKAYGKKRILALLLAGMLGITTYIPVAATSLDEAQDKKEEAQENLDEINQQIKDIHSAQNNLQAEMNAYDEQLMMLLTDMEILKSDMETQEQEIEQANASLEYAKAEEEKQYAAMKRRIQYMYENGDQSIWTAIIGAESITDLLNRVEYVTDVYEYDRQLLTDYQNVVQEVTELTEQLDNEMAEMEELNISYQEQQAFLEQIILEKSVQIEGFESQLKSAEKLATKYAKTIRQQNQIIAKEIARREAEEKAKREAEERAKREEEEKKNQANSDKGETSKGDTENSENTDKNENTENASDDSQKDTENSDGGKDNESSGLTDGGLNPPHQTGVSGSSVVSYASQFLGNPYVLGGNSLTNGTDCSGFINLVYQQFGVSLPRTSYALRFSGKAVSYENAQPGDIICYPGHVAIYIGNGKIIHASSPRTGICYGNATYRTITTVRRVL